MIVRGPDSGRESIMSLVLPAMNTLWFWFDKKTRRALHGTPRDVMRKFEVFKAKKIPLRGFEMFLMPSRLRSVDEFSPAFYDSFSSLEHGAVHVGETEADFLIANPAAPEQLSLLFEIMTRLGSQTLIIHAHHLRQQRPYIARLLAETLPGIEICVENNGFDDQWGGSLAGLRDIFADCPEFKFCLDIAHVKDFANNCSLGDVLAEEILLSRLREVHFSYSTILLKSDPYVPRGYLGYGPYHALFSVLGFQPSARTKEAVRSFPVVLEGIVPKEDAQLNYIVQEMALLDS